MDYRKLVEQAKEPLLSIGSGGEAVQTVQKLLGHLGYEIPPEEIGDKPVSARYGPATRQAVEGFQRDQKLSVDGVFGPATRAALWAALERKSAVTPQPVTPQPVTPQPVTPQPVTPQPVTPQPVTPQPVTPQPVTPAPIPAATQEASALLSGPGSAAPSDSALFLELARAASANVAPEAVRDLVNAFLVDQNPSSTRDEWIKLVALAGGFLTVWILALGLLFAPSERIEKLGNALGWLGVAGAGVSGAAVVRRR